MKRTIAILIFLLTISGFILVALDHLMSSPADGLHGFNRNFMSMKWKKTREARIKGHFNSFVGFENGKIYLASGIPGEVATVDVGSGSTVIEKFTVPQVNTLGADFQTILFAPYLYLSGTNSRKLFRINMISRQTEIFPLQVGPVLSTIIIDDQRAMIRYINTLTHDLEFRMINFVTGIAGVPVKAAPYPISDMFAFDGQLHYDKKSNLFCYVNYYCNGITIFEKEIEELQRKNTIDTMNTPKVMITHSGNSITHQAPPVTINNRSTVYDSKLYVHSAVKSDNELTSSFAENTVIDVYEKEYAGSFYIPVAPREVVALELISDNSLVVLLRDRLVFFESN